MTLRPIVNLRIVGAFELSIAEFFGNSFDVSGQETLPTGVTFNTDGTRMFVTGGNSDSVHQYSLSTGFDLSTASFTGTSFSVASQESKPQGIAFNTDGTRMFVTGGNSDSVHQYSLSTGFDLSTASFTGTSFDVSGQQGDTRGVTFNSDGTRMFVTGGASDSIFQYSLSTGFDLSTASFTGTSFDVSGQVFSTRGVAFSSDGTRMFVIGTNNDSVFQYSLSTGFDLSTASFTGTSFDVSGQDINPSDVVFNSDGTRMFITGADNDSVFEYLLGRLRPQS